MAEQMIPPDVLRRMVEGARAQGQLAPLQEQMAQVDKLRQVSAPQGRSVGASYQAASPMAHIGALLSSYGANKKYGKLEDQANALRGRVTAGDEARVESEALKAQAIQNIRQETRDTANLNAQTAQANAQTSKANSANALLKTKEAIAENKRRQGRFDTQQKELKQSAEEYIDDKGNVIQISRDRGGNLRNLNAYEEDGETYKKTTLDGLRKVTRGDKEVTAGLPAKERSHIIELRKAKLDLNNIRKYADKLSAEDRKQLAKGGVDSMLKAFIPGGFNEYVQANRGLSPEGREYMRSVAAFSAAIRNDLFGSALTVSESALAEAFLPSATGIDLPERMMRLNAYADDFERYNGKGGAYGREIYRDIPAYTPWANPDAAPAAPAAAVDYSTMTDEELDAALAAKGL